MFHLEDWSIWRYSNQRRFCTKYNKFTPSRASIRFWVAQYWSDGDLSLQEIIGYPKSQMSRRKWFVRCYKSIAQSLYVILNDRMEFSPEPFSAILSRDCVSFRISCKGVLNSSIKACKLGSILLNMVFQNLQMMRNIWKTQFLQQVQFFIVWRRNQTELPKTGRPNVRTRYTRYRMAQIRLWSGVPFLKKVSLALISLKTRVGRATKKKCLLLFSSSIWTTLEIWVLNKMALHVFALPVLQYLSEKL